MIRKLLISVLSAGALTIASTAYTAPNDDRRPDKPKHHVVKKTYKSAPKVRFYNPGHRVTRLPQGHYPINVRNKNYYYFGGQYYRPSNHGYLVVRAPLGARVRHLPAGFLTLFIGSQIFYQVNDTYYRRVDSEYVVVDEPEDIESARLEEVQPSEDESVAELIIYPKEAQDDEQLEMDRYQCHRWASEQTSFDPTLPNQPEGHRADYYRAMGACLEGRGYVVK